MRGTKAKMLRKLAASLTTEGPEMVGGGFYESRTSGFVIKPRLVGDPRRWKAGTFRRCLKLLKLDYRKMRFGARRAA